MQISRGNKCNFPVHSEKMLIPVVKINAHSQFPEKINYVFPVPNENKYPSQVPVKTIDFVPNPGDNALESRFPVNAKRQFPIQLNCSFPVPVNKIA